MNRFLLLAIYIRSTNINVLVFPIKLQLISLKTIMPFEQTICSRNEEVWFYLDEYDSKTL